MSIVEATQVKHSFPDQSKASDKFNSGAVRLITHVHYTDIRIYVTGSMNEYIDNDSQIHQHKDQRRRHEMAENCRF